jgi:hypothetical protein
VALASETHSLLVPALLFLLSGLLHLVQTVMQLCQGDALGKFHTIILHVIEPGIKILIAIEHHGIPAGIARLDLLQMLLLVMSEGIKAQMEGQHLPGEVLLGHGSPPAIALLLLAQGLFIAIRRGQPFPLGLSLAAPGFDLRALGVRSWRAHITIGIPSAPDHAIAEMAFSNISG